MNSVFFTINIFLEENNENKCHEKYHSETFHITVKTYV